MLHDTPNLFVLLNSGGSLISTIFLKPCFMGMGIQCDNLIVEMDQRRNLM